MKLRDCISYCYDNYEGITQEFSTISKAYEAAKKESKKHPEKEYNIYAMTTIYIKNGKDMYED